MMHDPHRPLSPHELVTLRTWQEDVSPKLASLERRLPRFYGAVVAATETGTGSVFPQGVRLRTKLELTNRHVIRPLRRLTLYVKLCQCFVSRDDALELAHVRHPGYLPPIDLDVILGGVAGEWELIETYRRLGGIARGRV